MNLGSYTVTKVVKTEIVRRNSTGQPRTDIRVRSTLTCFGPRTGEETSWRAGDTWPSELEVDAELRFGETYDLQLQAKGSK